MQEEFIVVINRRSRGKSSSIGISSISRYISNNIDNARGAIRTGNTRIEREEAEVDRNLLVGRSLFIFYL